MKKRLADADSGLFKSKAKTWIFCSTRSSSTDCFQERKDLPGGVTQGAIRLILTPRVAVFDRTIVAKDPSAMFLNLYHEVGGHLYNRDKGLYRNDPILDEVDSLHKALKAMRMAVRRGLFPYTQSEINQQDWYADRYGDTPGLVFTNFSRSPSDR